MFHISTDRSVPVAPLVPLCPTAHLAGETLLDTCLEVVVRVRVARVIRNVQLLNLCHGKPVEMACGRFWINFHHFLLESNWVVIENEVIWIMDKYPEVKPRVQTKEELVCFIVGPQPSGHVEGVVPTTPGIGEVFTPQMSLVGQRCSLCVANNYI